MLLLDKQVDLLEKELDLIGAAILQIDDVAKGIKNWAIVTWAAAVGVSLSSTALTPYVWLTAALPVLFWFVDASYRRVQRSFIERNHEISDFLNSTTFRNAVSSGDPIDFPLMKMRAARPTWWSNFFSVMMFKTIYILYVGLGALSLLAWFVAN